MAAVYVIDYMFLRGAVIESGVALFPTGCLVSFANRDVWIAKIILIWVETLALILLLIKSVGHLRYPGASLMKNICKDGVFYYACVLGLSITNVLVLRLASPGLCNFLLLPQGALQCILSNRLLLRLRGSGAMPWEEIRFASLTSMFKRALPDNVPEFA